MANPRVTAGLMKASLLPQAIAVNTPAITANAQPLVITIQPAPSAFERFSKTFATTPSPNKTSMSVPTNSPKHFASIEKLLFGFGFVESRRPIKRPTHRTLPEAVQLIALSPVQVWFPHAVNFPVFTEVFEISEVASNETRSIGRAQCGGCILC